MTESHPPRAIRHLPGYQRLLDVLFPESVRSRWRRLVTTPIPVRPEWDKETFCWAMDQIRQDNRQFLEFYGKPADFWTYDVAWLDGRNVKGSVDNDNVLVGQREDSAP